jgi:hypothetical protein
VKRPLGVSLIGYFYIFGAFILLVTTLFFDDEANQVGIAARFGLQNAIPEQLMCVILATISLIIIYGYLRIRKWGFWLMNIYSLIFGYISLFLVLAHNRQPFIGNPIWSIIVLIYTISVKRAFFQNETMDSAKVH